MPRLLATIENCSITLNDDGTLEYTAKAAIDDDGSGFSHHDPCFQSDTSLHHFGRALNADRERYIVVPPAIIHGVPGIVLGCQAWVSCRGRTVTAVVGDIGPHCKLGEDSIAVADALGLPDSPFTGGVDEHIVHYKIASGVPAEVDGVTYDLQASHAP